MNMSVSGRWGYGSIYLSLCQVSVPRIKNVLLFLEQGSHLFMENLYSAFRYREKEVGAVPASAISELPSA